jgi:hypothetical protein
MSEIISILWVIEPYYCPDPFIIFRFTRGVHNFTREFLTFTRGNAHFTRELT